MLYYFHMKVLFLYEVLESCKHSFKDAQSLEVVSYILLKTPLEHLINTVRY